MLNIKFVQVNKFNSAWDSELMKILSAAYMESLGHRSFRNMMINSIMDKIWCSRIIPGSIRVRT